MKARIGLLLILAAWGSLSQPSYGEEAWQTSWGKFVETWNACLQGCDRMQFVGKNVTWEGEVSNLKNEGGELFVNMEMPGPPLVDKSGVATNVLGLTLHPTPAQTESWRKVKKGQKVKFRTKTTEGYGGFVGFAALGSDKIALMYTEGAELVASVP